jgi:tetratricopeptide (TPR) repeat protein
MKLLKIIVVLIVGTLVSSCVSHKTIIPKVASIDPASLDTEQRKLFLKAKLTAESAVRQQQYAVASKEYLIAARITQSVDLAEKAVHYAERSEDIIGSMEAAQLWHKISPNDTIALSWKILGELRSRQNSQLQQSLDLLLSLTKLDSQGSFLKIMESITAIVAEPVTKNQLEIFADRHSNEPEVWLLMARLMEQLNDNKQAFIYIEKALSLNPNFIPAYELKGMILLRSGETVQAKKYFQTSVNRFPDNNKLKLQLAQIYYQQNQYSQSINLASQILENDSNALAARYLLAAIYFIQEKYDLSEIQFLVLLDKGYKQNTVYYFLGEINLETSKKDIAVQFFDAVTGGRNLTRSRINSANILAEKGQLDEALKRLRSVRTNELGEQVTLASTEINLLKKAGVLKSKIKNIIQTFSRNPSNFYLFTRVMNIAENSEQRKQFIQLALAASESLEVYKSIVVIGYGLSNQFDDTNLAMETLNQYLNQFSNDTELLYSRAMLKAQLGDIAGMDQDLSEILRLEPDNTDALNALGYSFADQKKDLGKAYEMILAAFQKRPHSAAIIDSLGWVLFRKGEFEKALLHLEKAWSQEPSAEVGAHFGEVLWVTNNKIKATEIWQQALKLDSKNKVLLDTMERLQQ